MLEQERSIEARLDSVEAALQVGAGLAPRGSGCGGFGCVVLQYEAAWVQASH